MPAVGSDSSPASGEVSAAEDKGLTSTTDSEQVSLNGIAAGIDWRVGINICSRFRGSIGKDSEAGDGSSLSLELTVAPPRLHPI